MTSDIKADFLVTWLSENAFFNVDSVQLDTSKTKLSALPIVNDQDETEAMEGFTIEVIPKANILSFKNGRILNLLQDFEPELTEYDQLDELSLDSCIPKLLLTIIYEMSNGEKSPWFHYLQSIDFNSFYLPICLWSDIDKKLLTNSKYDLLNQTGDENLVALFEKCQAFAKLNKLYIPQPDLLSDNSKLKLFSKILYFVLRNSVFIDEYHGFAIVPGSELFMNSAWHVEFESNTDPICVECGEEHCDHQDEDEDEDEDEEDQDVDEYEDEVQELEDEQGENDESDMEAAIDGNISLVDLTDEEKAEDWEIESSDDSGDDIDVENDENEVDDENDDDDDEDENSLTEEIDNDEDTLEEITIEYIQKLEEELNSDDENDSSPGEEEEMEEESHLESELELSDDEESTEQKARGDDLQKQLMNDQCVAINCLEYVEGEKFVEFDKEKERAFGFYGYVYMKEVDECLLTVPFFRHLKRMSKARRELMEIKLEWFQEIGFELMKDIVQAQMDHEHDHDHDHDHGNENEDEGCCGEEHGDGCGEEDCHDCGDEHHDEDIDDGPSSWELSITVGKDGKPSVFTYAIIKLILMPFNLFFNKFIKCTGELKLVRRVVNFLMPGTNIPAPLQPRKKRDEKEIISIFNNWCNESLQRYKEANFKSNNEEKVFIEEIINQEKEILARGKSLKKL